MSTVAMASNIDSKARLPHREIEPTLLPALIKIKHPYHNNVMIANCNGPYLIFENPDVKFSQSGNVRLINYNNACEVKLRKKVKKPAKNQTALTLLAFHSSLFVTGLSSFAFVSLRFRSSSLDPRQNLAAAAAPDPDVVQHGVGTTGGEGGEVLRPMDGVRSGRGLPYDRVSVRILLYTPLNRWNKS